MATLTILGPSDHGRPLEYEEFRTGEYVLGYKYELIDGRLFVSPEANYPEDRLKRWLFLHLTLYARFRPEIINYVSPGARVFVPGRSAKATCPEPDLAAYRG